MNLRFYRAFATELTKIAGGLPDSDIRKLLAERKGEEYLEGGKLKNAGSFALAAGAHDLHSRTKVDGHYQNLRDNAAAAGKGALTGAAVVGLADKLSKNPFANHTHYRRAAGLGAAGMVADRAYRHHKAKADAAHVEKVAIVAPNPERAFHSPAESMASSSRVGSFKSGITRSGLGTPSKVVQLGNKFKMPPLGG